MQQMCSQNARGNLSNGSRIGFLYQWTENISTVKPIGLPRVYLGHVEGLIFNFIKKVSDFYCPTLHYIGINLSVVQMFFSLRDLHFRFI
jgi:hypothetical protein